MTSKPLVSVIIPTYDQRAQRLQSALASVYAQQGLGGLFDLEVIVADNASSPPTQEVIRRFPGVRHLRFETNRGLWVALNAGLQTATGELVAFLIDDDLWLPEKLRLQVPALARQTEVGVVYSQQIVVYGNDVFVWPDTRAPSGSVFRALLKENFVGERSILVPRKVFEKVGYFDETLSACGDYDMWLRLAFHFPFTFLPAPVAMYLRSPRGLYSTDIARGGTEREYPLVVERALAMLQDTVPDAAEVRKEALAHVELNLSGDMESVGEYDRMRSHLLRGLVQFPWIAEEAWARPSIVRRVCLFALSSASPIDAVHGFSAELRAAGGDIRLPDRVKVRRLLADVWGQVAIGLSRDKSRSARMAGQAAVRAILYYPPMLRRKDLARLMLRAALRTRS